MKKSTEDSESLTEDTEEDGKEALNTPNHDDDDDVDNNIKNGKLLGRLKHKCLNIRRLVFLYVYNNF